MKRPATRDERGRKSPAKLFISYSRKDRSFAERLSAALHASGYDVWVDVKGIRPSEDWLNAVYSAIEGADVFVFVVSPDSVDPVSICAREIERAVGHHKRIVPVAYRSIDTRTVPVPESIGRLNWISCLETQEFDLCVSILKGAIETDLEWAKAHTRMLVRAVEWDAAKRDDSYLLQKNDLALAEQWLALGPEREPRPTTLQTEYIVQSRTTTTRRQRRLTVIGLVAVLLVGIGGTTAVYEFRQAGTRRKEAISRQLSAEAQFEIGRRLDRAILLTAQAFSILPLQEVLSSAITIGQAAARVQKILRGHTNRIAAMCFLPNDRLLVSADDGGRVILWDTDSGSPLQLLSSSSIAVACSSVTPVVAVVNGGTVILWRVDGDRATRSLTIADDIAQIQFSQNGMHVVTVGETVKVRSARTGELVGSAISGSYVSVSAVSDSGDLVAMGTAGGEHDEHGGEVLVWRGGKESFSNTLSAIGVKTLIVDSKREKILAVGDGGEVKAWKFDGTTEEKKRPENVDIRPTKTAAFDAGGDLVAIGQGRAAFQCEVTTQNMECKAHFAGHASAVSAVALSPSKSLAATGSEDGMIIVHRLLSKNAFEGGWAVEGDMGGAADKLEFSSDGTALIIRDSSKVLQRVPLPVELTANSGSASRFPKPSVNFLAPRISIVVEDDRARLMDQDRKLGEMTPEPGKQVTVACTTPDGRRWAAIANDSVRIANIRENHTYQGVVPSGFGNITSVAISPDGALLAVAGSKLLEAFDGSAGMEEKEIVLIDGETGRTVGMPVKTPSPAITLAMTFSQDGQYLASASQADLNVWIAGPNLWLRRACAALDVRISATEWQRRLPGTAYPASCASGERAVNPEILNIFAHRKQ